MMNRERKKERERETERGARGASHHHPLPGAPRRALTCTPLSLLFSLSDPSTSTLLGCATLIIERKFLRQCGAAGHIEDVVVDAAARGRRLGARLIEAAADAAKAAGCYKVILDCSESNVAFYEKCGLTRKEVQMVRYF